MEKWIPENEVMMTTHTSRLPDVPSWATAIRHHDHRAHHETEQTGNIDASPLHDKNAKAKRWNICLAMGSYGRQGGNTASRPSSWTTSSSMKNDGIPCTFPVTRMKEVIMSFSEHHIMTNNSLSMRGNIHEESGYRCRIGWRNNGQSDRKPLKQEVVEIDSEEHLAGNRMMAKMKTVWQFIKSSLVPLNGSGRSDNDSGYWLCRDIWDIICFLHDLNNMVRKFLYMTISRQIILKSLKVLNNMLIWFFIVLVSTSSDIFQVW